VTVLSKFFTENPELTDLRRQIVSILPKDRLTQVVLDLLNNLPGSSSSRPIVPTESMMKVNLSLGMSVTLSGGVDKVKCLSIEEIEERIEENLSSISSIDKAFTSRSFFEILSSSKDPRNAPSRSCPRRYYSSDQDRAHAPL